ncbi:MULTISPECIES: hypothetical protein [unclassified Spirosoma]|uniref:hypothetical protein n=1 Tax=unclassified Spirosoma TaxID=2621999 RepID=UPI00096949C3|nr:MULTISPECIES: hypothetical protein [unclassified Spirosoma]MBN8820651.1 hypothetical protein [Spirosoma sp.]OJW78026.1 MAG: hypothetical protein BGO59_28820 [Spirosoma sp. 48-14]
MTPYEGTLAKKLTQAFELGQMMAKWRQRSKQEAFPEELILESIINRIDQINQQFDEQLHEYQTLTDARKEVANGSVSGIRQVIDRVWTDVCDQSTSDSVATSLVKNLHQKIQRFTLPAFPINGRKPFFYKEIRLYEDSYALLGQYYSWFIDLLIVVNFSPLHESVCLNTLRQQAHEFNRQTKQIMEEAEKLKNLQLARDYLFKLLNQATVAARGRLSAYKQEAYRSYR